MPPWKSRKMYTLRSKKQPHFICVTFVFLTIMKQRISLWNRYCPLPIRCNSFWYAVAFTEQRCLFDTCIFLLTKYCGHKRTKIVFYWIAGGVYKSAGENYWSAMSFSNPRCSLLIRGVIYQSAGVNNWSAEKKFKCLFIWVQYPNFLWKNVPLHNPFREVCA